MTYLPPPPPIGQEEFNKRVAAGAKTFEEIDPDFCRWLKSSRRSRMVQGVVLAVSGIVVILFIFWCTIRP